MSPVACETELFPSLPLSSEAESEACWVSMFTAQAAEQLLIPAEPSPKKTRFGDWCSEDTGASLKTVSEEMATYLSVGRLDTDDPAAQLNWWRARESVCPLLAKLARRVLAIPATSTSSERNFSSAGLLLTDRRSSLSPRNVNNLLVIHSHYMDEDKGHEGTKTAS